MQRMFASATVKLTSWYLLIIVIISLLFSVIVFQVATREIRTRLETFQIQLEDGQSITLPGPLTLTDVRMNQTREARLSIFVGLLYVNLAVLGLGGIGAYWLARRTLQPIEAAHEAQSRFTSDASHELKTPLAAMKSELEVSLRDTALKKTELREILKSNLEEVDKLTNLSQALLQLSRMNYADLPLTDRIDVNRLIDETVHWYDQQSARITISRAKANHTIDGNEVILRDAVRIILDNAFKYSPSGTPINVAVFSDGRITTVTISNQGEGIAPDHIEHIFDRFYRVDTSRSQSDSAGYGLGLALAKQIVELHSGTISATSTPGQTTAFTIELPNIQKK